jgi:hypothetical protein
MTCAFSPVSLAISFPLARHIIDERRRAADQARLARAARRNAALPHAPDTRTPVPSRQRLNMPRDSSPAARAAPGEATPIPSARAHPNRRQTEPMSM